jgi:hypothetical protein
MMFNYVRLRPLFCSKSAARILLQVVSICRQPAADVCFRTGRSMIMHENKAIVRSSLPQRTRLPRVVRRQRRMSFLGQATEKFLGGQSCSGRSMGRGEGMDAYKKAPRPRGRSGQGGSDICLTWRRGQRLPHKLGHWLIGLARRAHRRHQMAKMQLSAARSRRVYSAK